MLGISRNDVAVGLAPTLLLALFVACGGGDGNGGTPPTSPSPPTNPGGGGGGGGSTTNTITIGASGVSPRDITIAVGSRVTFVNSSSAAHDMSSDPHPAHTDCVEINEVSFIQPGETKQTGVFGTARTCGFHDHNQPTNAALQGRITVQ